MCMNAVMFQPTCIFRASFYSRTSQTTNCCLQRLKKLRHHYPQPPSLLPPFRHYSTAINRVKATSWPPSSDVLSPAEAARSVGRRTAYVAMGSNLGDRIGMIEQACNHMTKRGIKVTRTSSLWETKPMYVLDQAEFLNGVCEIETTLEPIQLLDELQDIERTMDRRKIVDKGPRNIDLDILLYGGNQTFHNDRLTIPHIGLTEREFALRPLAELIPSMAIKAEKPWRLCQEYLNALPEAASPMSTISPLIDGGSLVEALRTTRKTRVMAIVNVTDDSFSDGGDYRKHSWIDRIDALIDKGIAIVDIGGQSTAPGAPEISTEEETLRVVKMITSIRAASREPIISVDTYRAAVAEAAVSAGADIINDVSAGQMDSDMLSTMARLGKTIILMHMRGTPATMSTLTSYPDGLISTIAHDLLARVAEAEAAGVRRWRIILDPGIGFAKTTTQNLEILRRFDELRDWPGLRGLPWLVGSSRKRFIGEVTGVSEPADRLFGTAATVVAAVQAGADIVRVHDAIEMAEVVKMADAIWRV